MKFYSLVDLKRPQWENWADSFPTSNVGPARSFTVIVIESLKKWLNCVADWTPPDKNEKHKNNLTSTNMTRAVIWLNKQTDTAVMAASSFLYWRDKITFNHPNFPSLKCAILPSENNIFFGFRKKTWTEHNKMAHLNFIHSLIGILYL